MLNSDPAIRKGWRGIQQRLPIHGRLVCTETEIYSICAPGANINETMFDLILCNAKLMDGRVVDIAIKNGAICAIAPKITESATADLNAEGRLTIPAFVNGQPPACKSFWRRLPQTLPEEIQALPLFEAAEHVKHL